MKPEINEIVEVTHVNGSVEIFKVTRNDIPSYNGSDDRPCFTGYRLVKTRNQWTVKDDTCTPIDRITKNKMQDPAK